MFVTTFLSACGSSLLFIVKLWFFFFKWGTVVNWLTIVILLGFIYKCVICKSLFMLIILLFLSLSLPLYNLFSARVFSLSSSSPPPLSPFSVLSYLSLRPPFSLSLSGLGDLYFLFHFQLAGVYMTSFASHVSSSSVQICSCLVIWSSQCIPSFQFYQRFDCAKVCFTQLHIFTRQWC